MWKDPITATPSIIQIGFGPWGQNIPGDGEQYCSPTSMVMGLYWLSANGFTQLAPATYEGPDDPAATNLERVIAGLAETSSVGGTTGTGMAKGMADYLSACGITPTQAPLVSSNNPYLQWLIDQFAPNIAPDSDTIVLGNFSVAWFSRACVTDTAFTFGGGHVLAPLVVEVAVVVNNAYPSTFILNAANVPASNPQTVMILPVPSGWTLPGLGESQDYAQVVTDMLGPDQLEVAILWGAQIWSIPASVLPSSSGYRPSSWTIAGSKSINTNAGTLTVLAPLVGAGGLAKSGEGTLLLTNTNSLTGANSVIGGILASTQTSETPFGSGAVTLAGGALQLSCDGAAASVLIASGLGARCNLSTGGGSLQLAGSGAYTVAIGGNTDGKTQNIHRTTATATLIIAAGAGIAELGHTQQVYVVGTGGNLPAVSNEIVAPCIVGVDNDMAGSGSFLTYSETKGFQAATLKSSATTIIDDVTSDMVYEVVDEQTIGVASVQVAALEMNGGEINGSAASLLVGSQASGDVAGLIMNGGNINAGTLSFGAAQGFIYSNLGDGSTGISSVISGSAGLTVFGRGGLVLGADSSATLSGQININSGLLNAANLHGSATGSGEIFVYGQAILQVSGPVAGDITVEQSGTLYLDGGTVQGSISIAEIGYTTDRPGGILEGGGTIASGSSFGGIIRSGPEAGTIEFQDNVKIFTGTNFFWRLQTFVDNTNSQPGVGWNALQFNSADSVVGENGAGIPFFLDFSLLPGGDPDGGNEFWNTTRTWTLFTYAADGGYCWYQYGNFTYESGSFSLAFSGWAFCLTWTPVTPRRSPAERRRADLDARAALAHQSGRPDKP